ncbi:class I SAM-dependent methyltransferase [Piscinibacter terrae]|uniref:Class I SAM-dependent methyltransferase n=1 Tax=Piscinibacter terrae TaxID=2496871 RepID=A0A3N7HZR2_9BURK|nr:SAM-dependent methyltransferase [Albitalea terrae]RQP26611.1 class I SAM-dependent methyltransferase [Albitalea terrae]
MQSKEPSSVSGALASLIRRAIVRDGGWLPFDRFMAMALYAPGLGYYSRGDRQFGSLPSSGSDFVTAPQLSPFFGRALAQQVAQALVGSSSDEVFEFGAGTGALALQLLQALGDRVRQYSIVDLSGTLREKQRQTLGALASKVRWLDALPERMSGVVIGNEVLDAMPVQLLHFDGRTWFERGVSLDGERFAWADQITDLRPPVDSPFVPGTTTEIHPQAKAYIATLAERLERGAAFFIDYGFPEAEYYLAQRTGGTLMCHRAHKADTDPLSDVGDKDITAHVDFTGIAMAAQDAGLDVLGYATQARFLMNCGILQMLQGEGVAAVANAQKLLNEHEMGELFKVIGFARNCDAAFTTNPVGFTSGDRTHTL